MKSGRLSEILRWTSIIIAAAMVIVLIWLFAFDGWNKIMPIHKTIEDPKLDIVSTDRPKKLSITDDVTSQVLLGNVYATLFTLKPDGTPKPSIAEDWKTSDNGMKISMGIRSDVKATNGVKITPSVVVKSLHNNIQGKYPYYDVVTKTISRVEEHKNSVLITLNHPMAVLPFLLAGPLGAIGTDGEHEVKPGDVATGPYSISSFKDSTIILKRNHGWPNKTSNEMSIKWTDDATSMSDMRTLKATHVLKTSDDDANHNDTYKKTYGPSTHGVMIVYNSNASRPYPALSDIRYRQGVSQSIDRQALTESIGGGLKANSDPVPLGSTYWSDAGSILPYDPHDGASKTSYFGANPLRMLTRASDSDNTRQILVKNFRSVGQYVRSYGDSSSIDDGNWDAALIDHHGFDLKEFTDGNDLTSLDAPDTSTAYDAVFTAGTLDDLKSAISGLARSLVNWAPATWVGNYQNVFIMQNDYVAPNPGFVDVRIDLTALSCGDHS